MPALFGSQNKTPSFSMGSSRGGLFGGTQDTKTATGLYNTAVQNGLQKEADQILAQKGEQPEIFSGGMFSDIMDTLNALDYGVVGMLKGKSFMDGVKNRESFTDEDALGGSIGGTIAGTILDIAVDPLTYIAPTTILSKIPGATKLAKVAKAKVFGEMAEKTIQETGKTYQALEGGTKVGRWFADKFAYSFGKDPQFLNTIERTMKNIGVSENGINKLVSGIAKLPQEKLGQLLTKDETGRFVRRGIDELQGFTEDELLDVSKTYSILDDLGKEAVDLGLLNKGTWEENVGQYIKNTYEKFELEKGNLFGFGKNKVKGIKARKDLTPEQIKELGQIDNPGYLLLKSMTDLSMDIENTKLFNGLAKNFGSDVAQDGFTKMPNSKSYGALADKFVPEPIQKYLTELEQARGESDKMWSKAIGAFKYNKVILNPATHARNIMSNMILNYWKLGVNPITNGKDYAEAFGEIAKGGGKWIKEAKSVGYGIDSFASNELKNNLLAGKKGIPGKISKVSEGLADMYQREENFAKLTAFIAQRKKGIPIEEAWKAAESATFNYAQVTPFVRRLRQSIWGFPFITFTIKATPLAAETALNKTGRVSVIGKIKNSIENQTNQEELKKERASEPAWIRDGFYVKLPMKDENGNSAYFDLTYIIPFGDLMSGQFLEGKVNRDTGLEEGKPQALLSKNPTLNFISEIAKNEDFYGDKIWNDSDPQEKKLGDLFRHLSKTFLPPAISDQLPGGYIQSGDKQGQHRERGIIGTTQPQEQQAQQRTLTEEMLKQVGMKIQPINVDIQDTYMEYEKKKALQTLLREKGLLKSFDINYIPK